MVTELTDLLQRDSSGESKGSRIPSLTGGRGPQRIALIGRRIVLQAGAGAALLSGTAAAQVDSSITESVGAVMPIVMLYAILFLAAFSIVMFAVSGFMVDPDRRSFFIGVSTWSGFVALAIFPVAIIIDQILAALPFEATQGIDLVPII